MNDNWIIATNWRFYAFLSIFQLQDNLQRLHRSISRSYGVDISLNHSVCSKKYSSAVVGGPRRSSALFSMTPQPWSRGQTSAYNWRNTPSELYDFHSQSQGRCWYFRTALETLSTQIGGECSSLPREKRLFDLLGVRIWQWIYVECILTTRDLTSWSQPYRDDKCTKQLYSVWILPVNYKRIMNRHARRIDPRVDLLTTLLAKHMVRAAPTTEWLEILTRRGSRDQWQLISLWRMWGILNKHPLRTFVS